MTYLYSQIPVGTNSCTVCGTICDDCDNICLNCNSWKCLICQNKNNSIQYFRSDKELRIHLLSHPGIVESTPSAGKQKFQERLATLKAAHAAKNLKKEDNSNADDAKI